MPIYILYENIFVVRIPFPIVNLEFDVRITHKQAFVMIVRSFALLFSALLFFGAIKLTDDAMTVAQDGSGHFRTVSEAVAAAPSFSKKPVRIHIKAGVYREHVEVGQNKTNIYFIGDGIGKTVITDDRHKNQSVTTLSTATVVVKGFGFVAQNITFENSAGPESGEAVALGNQADRSAFYQCSFRGHQATLYAKSGRQFYWDCHIYGTLDFIFGSAAAVFLKCGINVRRLPDEQILSIIAQGKKPGIEPSGFSIQKCIIAAAPDSASTTSPLTAYLGRPRSAYSSVVVIYSVLGDLIDPAGWLDWNGRSALDTLYLGEYKNHGPGADTTRRVRWRGCHILNSQAEASNCTAEVLLGGIKWLSKVGIPFHSLNNLIV